MSVNYKVTVDTADAIKNIKSLQSDLRNTVNVAGKAMAGLSAAAAGAAAAIYAFGRAGMAAADEQVKFARSVGATQAAMRALDLAASDAGVSQNVLRSAVEKLNLEIGRARQGTGQAAKAFEVLGISIEQIARLNADERLALIADRVKELGLSSDQTAALLKQLGMSNAEMTLLMSQGGDAIRGARKEIEDYGLALSEVDSSRIEAANDAMSRLGLVMEGIQMKLAAEFAPILSVLAGRFNEAAREAGGFGEATSSAFRTSAMAVGYFLNMLNGIRVVFKGLLVVAHGFSATMITVMTTAAQAVAFLLDGVTYAINSTIRALNAIPGVDIEFVTPVAQSRFMKNLRELAQGSRDEVAKAAQNLHDAAMTTIPTDAIRDFFAEVDAAHAEMMERLDARTQENPISLPIISVGGGISSEQQRELDRAAEELKRYQARIRGTALSYLPLKRAQEDFIAKTKDLNAAMTLGLISTQEHAVAMANLKREYDNFLSSQRGKATTWAEGWKSAFEDYKVAANDAAAHGKRAFETATRGMEDLIVNFAKTGKFEWKNFVAMMLEELLRAQIQMLFANMLGTMTSGIQGAAGMSGMQQQGAQQQQGGIMEGIQSVLGNIGNTIGGVVGGVGNVIGQVGSVMKSIPQAIGGAMGGVTNAVKSIAGAVGGGLSTAVSGISNVVRSIGGGASNLVGSVVNGVKSIFGGFFADGGNIARGKIGVVGERGPELIRGPANITPLDNIGGGSQSVTYNINAVDAPSFRALLARDPGFIHAVAMQGAGAVPRR